MLERGDLVLDPAKHVAQRNGRDLNLTKKEFGVLEVLLSAEGRVVSAEELLEKAWDENADPFTNVVRVTIMTLRRKARRSAADRDYRRSGLQDMSIAEGPSLDGRPGRDGRRASPRRPGVTSDPSLTRTTSAARGA